MRSGMGMAVVTGAEEARLSVKRAKTRVWAPQKFLLGVFGVGGWRKQAYSASCPKSKAYRDKFPGVGPPSRDHRLRRSPRTGPLPWAACRSG